MRPYLCGGVSLSQVAVQIGITICWTSKIKFNRSLYVAVNLKTILDNAGFDPCFQLFLLSDYDAE